MTGPGELRRLLAEGVVAVEGRLVSASNLTLRCRIDLDGRSVRAVYKPVAGERPLWDFPDGTLAAREVAAYAVSRSAGWDLVPVTVLREGPLGPGMVQHWVEDAETDLVDVVAPGDVPRGWLRVLDGEDGQGRSVCLVHADDARLRRMAVLDVVLNNADRKGGHVLSAPGGQLRGVDHGVCFHVEDKLRTVLWGWAGTPLTGDEAAVLEGLCARLGDAGSALARELCDLLAAEEVAATAARVERLLRRGRLPGPGQRWPSIPWPAF